MTECDVKPELNQRRRPVDPSNPVRAAERGGWLGKRDTMVNGERSERSGGRTDKQTEGGER